MEYAQTKSFRLHILPLAVIAAVAIVVGARYLNEPPAFIHAWAQSDNYSIALGFQHNGGDLFHPQTLIFNKQQKGFNDPVSLVTGCDFPLHHWLVSGLMSLTGSRQPWVFRGFTLAISIFGLWALYLLAHVLTGSRAKSLLTAAFTATAPSFAYYSSSFLPTAPALALAMGGLLLYALHLRDGKTWPLYGGILLLTLSMMTRTSFAVLWVAVACFQILRILRHEASLRESWLPFAIGTAAFAAWWLWSLHLRNKYGSLFLGSLLPVRSLEDAKEILHNLYHRWRLHFFQHAHYALLTVAAIGATIMLMVRKKSTTPDRKKLSLWWLLSIWVFGELLFVAAMSQQFMHHDYYFLDSLFLPTVLFLILTLGNLPNPSQKWSQIASLLLLLALTTWMTFEACEMQKVRRTEGVEAYQTAIRYQNANKMLEENGFGSRDLRFMTLFSYPQNTPFVMMDREGFAVMWNDPKVVAHALTFDFDYILVEDNIFRQLFGEAPILSRLQRLAGNGEISVCALSDSARHTSSEQFFNESVQH